MLKIILVSGGVSANSMLRKKFYNLSKNGFEVYFPRNEFATDNAAMIGLAGYLKYIKSDDKSFFKNESLKQNAYARLDYEKF